MRHDTALKEQVCSLDKVFFQLTIVKVRHPFLSFPVTIQVPDSCRLRRRTRKREASWGHPRPRQEDCVPLLSSYLSRANAKAIIHDALSILPLRNPPLRASQTSSNVLPTPRERKSVARRVGPRRATLFLSFFCSRRLLVLAEQCDF